MKTKRMKAIKGVNAVNLMCPMRKFVWPIDARTSSLLRKYPNDSVEEEDNYMNFEGRVKLYFDTNCKF